MLGQCATRGMGEPRSFGPRIFEPCVFDPLAFDPHIGEGEGLCYEKSSPTIASCVRDGG